MSLEGAKLIVLNDDGTDGKIIKANGKKFSIGYYMSCDYILDDARAKGVHCEIQSDAFGRVTLHNLSQDHPICLNGKQIEAKRPLLHGGEIKILERKFRWEFVKTSSVEYEAADGCGDNFSTPKKQIGIPEQPPNSCPNLRPEKTIVQRFTVHNFKYCIQSDEDGNNSVEEIKETEVNLKDSSNENILDSNDVEEEIFSEDKSCRSTTPEPNTSNVANNTAYTPKLHIINSTENKENTSTQKKKTLLSNCGRSDLVITCYSPRVAGIKIETSFASIKKNSQEKQNYMTPKGAMSSLKNDSTPSTSAKNSSILKNTSMYLIDLTTPTRLRPNSPPNSGLIKSTTKKPIGLHSTTVGCKVTPATPNLGSISTNDVETPGTGSSIGSVITVDSSRSASVIEVTTDESSPGEIALKTPVKSALIKNATTPKRTPQSLMKRAILTSAQKQERPYIGTPRPLIHLRRDLLGTPKTPLSSNKNILKRKSLSVPSRQSLGGSRLQGDTSTPTSTQRMRRSSLIPPISSTTATTSTPFNQSTKGLKASCKTSPIYRTRNSLAKALNTSKARKSTSPIAVALGSKLVARARNSLCSASPIKKRIMEKRIGTPLKSQSSSLRKTLEVKSVEDNSSILKRDGTFILEQNPEVPDNISKIKDNPTNITFSPEKEKTELSKEEKQTDKTFSPVRQVSETCNVVNEKVLDNILLDDFGSSVENIKSSHVDDEDTSLKCTASEETDDLLEKIDYVLNKSDELKLQKSKRLETASELKETLENPSSYNEIPESLHANESVAENDSVVYIEEDDGDSQNSIDDVVLRVEEPSEESEEDKKSQASENDIKKEKILLEQVQSQDSKQSNEEILSQPVIEFPEEILLNPEVDEKASDEPGGSFKTTIEEPLDDDSHLKEHKKGSFKNASKVTFEELDSTEAIDKNISLNASEPLIEHPEEEDKEIETFSSPITEIISKEDNQDLDSNSDCIPEISLDCSPLESEESFMQSERETKTFAKVHQTETELPNLKGLQEMLKSPKIANKSVTSDIKDLGHLTGTPKAALVVDFLSDISETSNISSEQTNEGAEDNEKNQMDAQTSSLKAVPEILQTPKDSNSQTTNLKHLNTTPRAIPIIVGTTELFEIPTASVKVAAKEHYSTNVLFSENFAEGLKQQNEDDLDIFAESQRIPCVKANLEYKSAAPIYEDISDVFDDSIGDEIPETQNIGKNIMLFSADSSVDEIPETQEVVSAAEKPLHAELDKSINISLLDEDDDEDVSIVETQQNEEEEFKTNVISKSNYEQEDDFVDVFENEADDSQDFEPLAVTDTEDCPTDKEDSIVIYTQKRLHPDSIIYTPKSTKKKKIHDDSSPKTPGTVDVRENEITIELEHDDKVSELKRKDLENVKESLKTPNRSSTPRMKGKQCSTPYMGDLKNVLETPVLGTPISRLSLADKQSNSSLLIKRNITLSNINIQQGFNDTESEGLDKFFKTPTAKNVMIPGEPPSATLKPDSDSVELIQSTEYSLNATGTHNLEEMFKTPVASRFAERLESFDETEDETPEFSKEDKTESKQNLSAEEAFDKLIGEESNLTPVKKVYARKSKTQSVGKSPFSASDVISDLPKTDVQEWIDSLEDAEVPNDTFDEDCRDRDRTESEDVTIASIKNTTCDPLASSVVKNKTSISKVCLADDTNISEGLVDISVASARNDPLAASVLKEVPKKSTNSIAEDKPIEADISGLDLLDQTAESVFSEPLYVSDTESLNKSQEEDNKSLMKDIEIDLQIEALIEKSDETLTEENVDLTKDANHTMTLESADISEILETKNESKDHIEKEEDISNTLQKPKEIIEEKSSSEEVSEIRNADSEILENDKKLSTDKEDKENQISNDEINLNENTNEKQIEPLRRFTRRASQSSQLSENLEPQLPLTPRRTRRTSQTASEVCVTPSLKRDKRCSEDSKEPSFDIIPKEKLIQTLMEEKSRTPRLRRRASQSFEPVTTPIRITKRRASLSNAAGISESSSEVNEASKPLLESIKSLQDPSNSPLRPRRKSLSSENSKTPSRLSRNRRQSETSNPDIITEAIEVTNMDTIPEEYQSSIDPEEPVEVNIEKALEESEKLKEAITSTEKEVKKQQDSINNDKILTEKNSQKPPRRRRASQSLEPVTTPMRITKRRASLSNAPQISLVSSAEANQTSKSLLEVLKPLDDPINSPRRSCRKSLTSENPKTPSRLGHCRRLSETNNPDIITEAIEETNMDPIPEENQDLKDKASDELVRANAEQAMKESEKLEEAIGTSEEEINNVKDDTKLEYKMRDTTENKEVEISASNVSAKKDEDQTERPLENSQEGGDEIHSVTVEEEHDAKEESKGIDLESNYNATCLLVKDEDLEKSKSEDEMSKIAEEVENNYKAVTLDSSEIIKEAPQSESDKENIVIKSELNVIDEQIDITSNIEELASVAEYQRSPSKSIPERKKEKDLSVSEDLEKLKEVVSQKEQDLGDDNNLPDEQNKDLDTESSSDSQIKLQRKETLVAEKDSSKNTIKTNDKDVASKENCTSIQDIVKIEDSAESNETKSDEQKQISKIKEEEEQSSDQETSNDMFVNKDIVPDILEQTESKEIKEEHLEISGEQVVVASKEIKECNTKEGVSHKESLANESSEEEEIKASQQISLEEKSSDDSILIEGNDLLLSEMNEVEASKKQDTENHAPKTLDEQKLEGSPISDFTETKKDLEETFYEEEDSFSKPEKDRFTPAVTQPLVVSGSNKSEDKAGDATSCIQEVVQKSMEKTPEKLNAKTLKDPHVFAVPKSPRLPLSPGAKFDSEPKEIDHNLIRKEEAASSIVKGLDIKEMQTLIEKINSGDSCFIKSPNKTSAKEKPSNTLDKQEVESEALIPEIVVIHSKDIKEKDNQLLAENNAVLESSEIIGKDKQNVDIGDKDIFDASIDEDYGNKDQSTKKQNYAEITLDANDILETSVISTVSNVCDEKKENIKAFLEVNQLSSNDVTESEEAEDSFDFIPETQDIIGPSKPLLVETINDKTLETVKEVDLCSTSIDQNITSSDLSNISMDLKEPDSKSSEIVKDILPASKLEQSIKILEDGEDISITEKLEQGSLLKEIGNNSLKINTSLIETANPSENLPESKIIEDINEVNASFDCIPETQEVAASSKPLLVRSTKTLEALKEDETSHPDEDLFSSSFDQNVPSFEVPQKHLQESENTDTVKNTLESEPKGIQLSQPLLESSQENLASSLIEGKDSKNKELNDSFVQEDESLNQTLESSQERKTSSLIEEPKHKEINDSFVKEDESLKQTLESSQVNFASSIDEDKEINDLVVKENDALKEASTSETKELQESFAEKSSVTSNTSKEVSFVLFDESVNEEKEDDHNEAIKEKTENDVAEKPVSEEEVDVRDEETVNELSLIKSEKESFGKDPETEPSIQAKDIIDASPILDINIKKSIEFSNTTDDITEEMPSCTKETSKSQDIEETEESSKDQETLGSSKDQETLGSSKDQETLELSKDQGIEQTSKAQETLESSKDQETLESSKDQETLESSKDQETLESSKDQETLESSKDQETLESSKDQETLESSKDQGIEQSSKAQETLESSKDQETLESSKDQETLESSKDQETEESSKDQESLESSKDQESLESSKDQETEESSKDQDTLESSKDQGIEQTSKDQESSKDKKTEETLEVNSNTMEDKELIEVADKKCDQATLLVCESDEEKEVMKEEEVSSHSLKSEEISGYNLVDFSDLHDRQSQNASRSKVQELKSDQLSISEPNVLTECNESANKPEQLNASETKETECTEDSRSESIEIVSDIIKSNVNMYEDQFSEPSSSENMEQDKEIQHSKSSGISKGTSILTLETSKNDEVSIADEDILTKQDDCKKKSKLLLVDQPGVLAERLSRKASGLGDEVETVLEAKSDSDTSEDNQKDMIGKIKDIVEDSIKSPTTSEESKLIKGFSDDKNKQEPTHTEDESRTNLDKEPSKKFLEAPKKTEEQIADKDKVSVDRAAPSKRLRRKASATVEDEIKIKEANQELQTISEKAKITLEIPEETVQKTAEKEKDLDSEVTGPPISICSKTSSASEDQVKVNEIQSETNAEEIKKPLEVSEEKIPDNEKKIPTVSSKRLRRNSSTTPEDEAKAMVEKSGLETISAQTKKVAEISKVEEKPSNKEKQSDPETVLPPKRVRRKSSANVEDEPEIRLAKGNTGKTSEEAEKESESTKAIDAAETTTLSKGLEGDTKVIELKPHVTIVSKETDKILQHSNDDKPAKGMSLKAAETAAPAVAKDTKKASKVTEKQILLDTAAPSRRLRRKASATPEDEIILSEKKAILEPISEKLKKSSDIDKDSVDETATSSKGLCAKESSIPKDEVQISVAKTDLETINKEPDVSENSRSIKEKTVPEKQETAVPSRRLRRQASATAEDETKANEARTNLSEKIDKNIEASANAEKGSSLVKRATRKPSQPSEASEDLPSRRNRRKASQDEEGIDMHSVAQKQMEPITEELKAVEEVPSENTPTEAQGKDKIEQKSEIIDLTSETTEDVEPNPRLKIISKENDKILEHSNDNKLAAPEDKSVDKGTKKESKVNEKQLVPEASVTPEEETKPISEPISEKLKESLNKEISSLAETATSSKGLCAKESSIPKDEVHVSVAKTDLEIINKDPKKVFEVSENSRSTKEETSTEKEATAVPSRRLRRQASATAEDETKANEARTNLTEKIDKNIEASANAEKGSSLVKRATRKGSQASETTEDLPSRRNRRKASQDEEGIDMHSVAQKQMEPITEELKAVEQVPSENVTEVKGKDKTAEQSKIIDLISEDDSGDELASKTSYKKQSTHPTKESEVTIPDTKTVTLPTSAVSLKSRQKSNRRQQLEEDLVKNSPATRIRRNRRATADEKPEELVVAELAAKKVTRKNRRNTTEDNPLDNETPLQVPTAISEIEEEKKSLEMEKEKEIPVTETAKQGKTETSAIRRKARGISQESQLQKQPSSSDAGNTSDAVSPIKRSGRGRKAAHIDDHKPQELPKRRGRHAAAAEEPHVDDIELNSLQPKEVSEHDTKKPGKVTRKRKSNTAEPSAGEDTSEHMEDQPVLPKRARRHKDEEAPLPVEEEHIEIGANQAENISAAQDIELSEDLDKSPKTTVGRNRRSGSALDFESTSVTTQLRQKGRKRKSSDQEKPNVEIENIVHRVHTEILQTDNKVLTVTPRRGRRPKHPPQPPTTTEAEKVQSADQTHPLIAKRVRRGLEASNSNVDGHRELEENAASSEGVESKAISSNLPKRARRAKNVLKADEANEIELHKELEVKEPAATLEQRTELQSTEIHDENSDVQQNNEEASSPSSSTAATSTATSKRSRRHKNHEDQNAKDSKAASETKVEDVLKVSPVQATKRGGRRAKAASHDEDDHVAEKQAKALESTSGAATIQKRGRRKEVTADDKNEHHESEQTVQTAILETVEKTIAQDPLHETDASHSKRGRAKKPVAYAEFPDDDDPPHKAKKKRNSLSHSQKSDKTKKSAESEQDSPVEEQLKEDNLTVTTKDELEEEPTTSAKAKVRGKGKQDNAASHGNKEDSSTTPELTPHDEAHVVKRPIAGRRARKVSAHIVEELSSEPMSTPLSPRREGRNIPRHNYDESSDSEHQKNSQSKRNILTKENIENNVTPRTGRTRKPTAIVQEYLEKERTKTATPKSKPAGMLHKISAPESAKIETPKAIVGGRRGRKPRLNEISPPDQSMETVDLLSSTPSATEAESSDHVEVTKSRGRGRGRTKISVPITNTPVVEEDVSTLPDLAKSEDNLKKQINISEHSTTNVEESSSNEPATSKKLTRARKPYAKKAKTPAPELHGTTSDDDEVPTSSKKEIPKSTTATSVEEEHLTSTVVKLPSKRTAAVIAALRTADDSPAAKKSRARKPTAKDTKSNDEPERLATALETVEIPESAPRGKRNASSRAAAAAAAAAKKVHFEASEDSAAGTQDRPMDTAVDSKAPSKELASVSRATRTRRK